MLPPDEFFDGSPEYEAACMVVIRLAAILERTDFAHAFEIVTDEEKRTIRTTRNIAAYAGCRSMNDELLYLAVTRRIPEIIKRVNAELDGGASG